MQNNNNESQYGWLPCGWNLEEEGNNNNANGQNHQPQPQNNNVPIQAIIEIEPPTGQVTTNGNGDNNNQSNTGQVNANGDGNNNVCQRNMQHLSRLVLNERITILVCFLCFLLSLCVGSFFFFTFLAYIRR